MPGPKTQSERITAFDLQPGRLLANRYEVIERLGGGWEGEVYRIRERTTGIERTAKLFYPHRNPRERAAKFYAKKLHKLRQCEIVIQYHTQAEITFRGARITFLVSEFVEGELLSQFLKRQRGGRLMPFQAVHLLHALASGIDCIHRMGEYHGDLHDENIIVQRFGLGFDLKLLDLFHWGAPRAENIRDDVVDLIHIFYEALGGAKHYAAQPDAVKQICCGLKRSLILRKFRSAGQLRGHLERMSWE
ncbi:MAG: protein kinase [Candidatus Eisenbacteria bacterium]|nr:protein kinase [Candidatus Eisenbacteria bacterium]